MRIFEYLFMQRAFVVGILLAAVVPCVGMVVVCKRLSMIGDALSHTSLAGRQSGGGRSGSLCGSVLRH